MLSDSEFFRKLGTTDCYHTHSNCCIVVTLQLDTLILRVAGLGCFYICWLPVPSCFLMSCRLSDKIMAFTHVPSCSQWSPVLFNHGLNEELSGLVG